MIDGVRQNFRFTGHEAQGFTYVDPSLLAGIEIAARRRIDGRRRRRARRHGQLPHSRREDILKPGQTVGALTSGYVGNQRPAGSGHGGGGGTSAGVGIAGAISRRNPTNYENGDGVTVPFTFQDLYSGLFKANFQLNEEKSLRFGGVFYDNDFFANSYFQQRDLEHVHGQVRLQADRQRPHRLQAERLPQRSRR